MIIRIIPGIEGKHALHQRPGLLHQRIGHVGDGRVRRAVADDRRTLISVETAEAPPLEINIVIRAQPYRGAGLNRNPAAIIHRHFRHGIIERVVIKS